MYDLRGVKVMRFCTNCGKGMDDDAVFCIGCGASTGSTSGETAANQTAGSGTTVSEQPNTGGAYYQSGVQSTPSGAYIAPGSQGIPPAYNQPSTQSTPGAPYYQAGTQNQPGTPYYPQAAPGAPSAPYYQNSPYGGGPSMPGGPKKNNKMVIIIVSVIVGLALIVGGILFYLSRTKDNNKDDDVNVTDDIEVSVKPSEDVVVISPSPSIEPEESEEPTPSEAEGLDVLDTATQDNIFAACDEIGVYTDLSGDFMYYGSWYQGDVYTFTYQDSVIDILLYDDGTVFSIETGGVQLYLDSYESFYFDEYVGYTTHFDESYPDSGYFFFINGEDPNCAVTFETGYDDDYVIQLINQTDGSVATAFLIQSGVSINLGIPEGDYVIQYMVGDTWLGTGELFGADTTFYQSDSIYSFYPENESTITLDVSGDAGIASTEITIDDFA